MIPDRARVLAAASDWGASADGDWIQTPSSLLLPVRRKGEPLMIKAANPADDEADHSALLAHWAGNGMVRLVAANETISLMERAGAVTLAQMAASERDAESMDILLSAAHALSMAPVWAGPARPLVTSRFAGIARDLLLNPPDADDLPLFQRALAMQEPLTREQSDWRLLHGDLHHFNLLPSARGWLAIDPKGLIGPAAYEVAPMLCNPLPDPVVHAPGRYRARAEQASERTGLALADILAWSFCHLAQCAAWATDPVERPFWRASLRIAAAQIDAA